MEFIKGYKYQTEQEAIDKKLKVDAYFYNPNNETKDFVSIEISGKVGNINEVDFYYFVWYEALSLVLDDPIEFEIT